MQDTEDLHRAFTSQIVKSSIVPLATDKSLFLSGPHKIRYFNQMHLTTAPAKLMTVDVENITYSPALSYPPCALTPIQHLLKLNQSNVTSQFWKLHASVN